MRSSQYIAHFRAKGSLGRTMRTGALDIHEERVGGLYETLELVLPGLVLGGGVKEIDGESLHGFDNQHYRQAPGIKRRTMVFL